MSFFLALWTTKKVSMKLPIVPVCKAAKVRKNGTAVVSIQYCFMSEARTGLGTGIAIHPKFWNRKRKCVSNCLPDIYGSPEKLNEKIEQELKNAQNIVSLELKRKENPLDFFKRYYNPDFSFEDVVSKVDIIDTKLF